MTRYAEAGVDIDAANRAVRLMADAVASTATPAVLSELGAFGGLYSLQGAGAAPVLVASIDGAGTKTELAARYGRWRGIGADVVNHCVDDIAVQGARPLFVLDYLACAALVPKTMAEIVEGMAEACRACGAALLGGETAEMPGVYAAGAVDVAAAIVGIVERDELLPRPERMAPGDAVIGLASDSPHTNGYSLIRLLLERRAACGGEDRVEDDGEFLDWLLAPHRSYLPELDELRAAGAAPKGLAHITGGGFLENIPRVLPGHLRAEIELGSWQVPSGFCRLVDWGDVADAEAFRTWNMGIGMVAIVDPSDSASAEALGHRRIGTLMALEECSAPDGARVDLVGEWR